MEMVTFTGRHCQLQAHDGFLVQRPLDKVLRLEAHPIHLGNVRNVINHDDPCRLQIFVMTLPGYRRSRRGRG